MSRLVLLFVLVLQSAVFYGQQMTSIKLMEIIEREADSTVVHENSLQFSFNDAILICIYDENANRMRIMTPIIKREELDDEALLNTLVANFHSALDVKYALSDEIIWSLYTHPLKELTEAQLVDAIQQVYAAAITFGNGYSSTNLVFPGNTKRKEEPKTKILKKF